MPGGAFTGLGAPVTTRNRIVAIDATGAPVSTWNPNASGVVSALAISSDGTKIYAGGAFTTIGGQTRNRIAALDSTTGAATTWDPNASNTVVSLALSPDGSTVYAGGTFTTIGGQTRNRIGGIATAGTGLATAFNPNSGTTTVSALAVSSDSSTVYAGGDVHHDRRPDPQPPRRTRRRDR